MAQTDSPYRDPRDARIETLEAENGELKKRLGEESPGVVALVPLSATALELPMDINKEIKRRKLEIDAERRAEKKERAKEWPKEKAIKKFVFRLVKKMKKVSAAMRKNDSIAMFKNEKIEFFFMPESIGRQSYFYIRNPAIDSANFYYGFGFWTRRRLADDLASKMIIYGIDLQEVVAMTEKNIIAFFAERAGK